MLGGEDSDEEEGVNRQLAEDKETGMGRCCWAKFSMAVRSLEGSRSEWRERLG